MDPRLRFKCVGCNYLMSADPSVTDTCRCGRLHKDSDAGRLTSSFGDDAVEVYELTD